jgi:hypothetical protein
MFIDLLPFPTASLVPLRARLPGDATAAAPGLTPARSWSLAVFRREFVVRRNEQHN